MPDRVETTSDIPAQQAVAFGIVQKELDEATSVISVEGDLDLSTAPRLKWMLEDALDGGERQIVIDLSLTTFMDSTALGVLVAFWRRLERGKKLVVVCTRPDVLRIFEYAGMDGAFAIFPALEKAIAYTREQAARAI